MGINKNATKPFSYQLDKGGAVRWMNRQMFVAIFRGKMPRNFLMLKIVQLLLGMKCPYYAFLKLKFGWKDEN